MFLDFTDQTGSFTAGNTITGATSGATATIKSIPTTLNCLELEDITGTFQDDEIIYESALGSELADSDLTDPFWSSLSGITVDDANTITITNIGCWIHSGSVPVSENTHYVVSFTPTFGTVSLPLFALYDLSNAAFIFVDEAMTDGVQNNFHFTTPSSCVSIRLYVIRLSSSTGTMDVDNYSCKQITNAALANGTQHSITASTSLDTDQAEFSIVDLSAESLPDEDACVEEVQSKLKRGTLSTTSKPTLAEVKRWLSRAKQELSETRSFTWRRRYTTITLTSGEYRYSLPPDFGGGHMTIRDKTNDNKIKVVTKHVFDTVYPDPAEVSSGEILVACIKNLELWVIPAPDGDDVLELEYKRTGDDALVGGTSTSKILAEDLTFMLDEDGGYILEEGSGSSTAGDFSWLPEIERFRCCDFALWMSFESLGNRVAADFYRNRWIKGYGRSMRSDGKRRWSTSGYRIRSMFQA